MGKWIEVEYWLHQ